MRKIEQITTKAFWNGDYIKMGNSTVYDLINAARYELHGNEIAYRENGKLTLFDGGWQTVTTKSRLNAILEAGNLPWRIRQKDYTWFAHNLETGEKIPFRNGWSISYR